MLAAATLVETASVSARRSPITRLNAGKEAFPSDGETMSAVQCSAMVESSTGEQHDVIAAICNGAFVDPAGIRVPSRAQR